MFDNVWQAAGVEGDHRGGAGVGLNAPKVTAQNM